MKKRILAVFLAVAALTGSLSACSGGTTTQTPTPSDETTPSSGADTAMRSPWGSPRTWTIVLTRIK